jgi:hypothetical protein
MVRFKVLPQYSPVGTKEYHEKPARMSGYSAEIGTGLRVQSITAKLANS